MENVMSDRKPAPGVNDIDLLYDLRKGIDNLDSALIAILAERFRLTEKVGKLKSSAGFELRDGQREDAQVVRYRELARSYGLNHEIVVDVMLRIIEHVKKRHAALTLGG
jgi:chorismate mutase